MEQVGIYPPEPCGRVEHRLSREHRPYVVFPPRISFTRRDQFRQFPFYAAQVAEGRKGTSSTPTVPFSSSVTTAKLL